MAEYRFEMAATKDLPTRELLEEALRDQVLDHPELWVKVPDYLMHRVTGIGVKRRGAAFYYPFNPYSIRSFGELVVEEKSDVDNGIWIRQYADAPEGMLYYVEAFNKAVERNEDAWGSFVIRGETVKLTYEAFTL